MKVRVYPYNDIRAYTTVASNPVGKPRKVSSNLCTWYYEDRKRFCGNYCSRRGVHGHIFNRRCWRHKRIGAYSKSLPPLVLVMISSSERTYNRDLWIDFLRKSERQGVPIELIIYHEDMLSCTVRDPQNLLSRFRPFPDVFNYPILSLRNSHGSLNFAQTYINMLKYACKIPSAGRCIVLTERTIPIRSPRNIYKRALASRCYLDVSYNVHFGPTPTSVTEIALRGKPYAGVNNLCQGLFTLEFLKIALPTVSRQCGKFGISLMNNRVYLITDSELFESWRRFSGANPSEFWLLNSFLLDSNHNRPTKLLTDYMDKSEPNDHYTVAEIPQWRNNYKRTYVFRDMHEKLVIPRFDRRAERYYSGVSFSDGVSLMDIISYIKNNKKRALFFRQVELP